MTTNEQMLGRADVNDLEAILAVSNTDANELIHAVEDNADAIFTWDYEKGQRPALNKLYEKAKTSQWNGETDLDWSIEVDPARVITGISDGGDPRFGPGGLRLGYGGGFYDRTLATLQPQPFTAGVGYAHGYIPWLSAEPHDVPLDALLTEDGLQWMRPGA